MNRGSDRHGPRQDSALSKDTEDVVRGTGSSRAEDWRDPEPSAEGQPRVSRSPEGSAGGGTPAGIDAEDADRRSTLARSLSGLRFPATTEQIRSAAERNQLPEELWEELQHLPADGRYASLADMWNALGHGIENRREQS